MTQRGKHNEEQNSADPSAAVALLAAIGRRTPARADRCEDIAKELKSQISGLKVGKTAGR